MLDENKRVVRRVYEEHYNQRQSALVGELFAVDVVLQTPDGALNGLDGELALLNAYATAFPDFRLGIDELTAEDDRVVVRYSFSGTHLGPLADIQPTGRHVQLTNGFGAFRLANGKVVRLDLAWDKHGLLQQLGVLTTGAGATGV
jgi:steroid delta-isomerase-like uncharacterized protein